MDHLIDIMNHTMKPSEEELVEEWESGNYKEISNCPHYSIVKSICDAMRHIYPLCPTEMPDKSPESIIEDAEEDKALDKFWEEKGKKLK